MARNYYLIYEAPAPPPTRHVENRPSRPLATCSGLPDLHCNPSQTHAKGRAAYRRSSQIFLLSNTLRTRQYAVIPCVYSRLGETASFPRRSLDLRPRLPLPDDDWLRYRSRATAARFQGTLSDVSLLIRVPTSASSRVLVGTDRISIDANPSTGTAIARPTTSTAYTSTAPATWRAPPTWPTRRIAVPGVPPRGHFSCPNSTRRREMQDHDVRRWP